MGLFMLFVIILLIVAIIILLKMLNNKEDKNEKRMSAIEKEMNRIVDEKVNDVINKLKK